MPIEIDQTQTEDNQVIEPKEVKRPEIEPEPGSEDQPEDNQVNPELEQELQVKLQPILLDSAINALGTTLAKLTSNDDMAFTEDEHKALVDAWTPILPSVSPMTNALLVTVIILSGKGLLYVASRKKVKPDTVKALPVQSKEVKEAID